MYLCICNTISLIGSDPAAITEETLIVSLYAYVVHMICQSTVTLCNYIFTYVYK